jgi:hypothetical protein
VPIQITAVRLSGGTAYEHIVHLWWTNPADGATGDNTRAQIVAWIENERGRPSPATPTAARRRSAW